MGLSCVLSKSILKIRMVQENRFFVTNFLPKSFWASELFEILYKSQSDFDKKIVTKKLVK